jgi:hypothetical protein
MEENPPTPAGSDKPRSRTPRAAFSTPEQPTPPQKPAERAAKRAAKAPPPVTFQPPSADENPSGTRSESPGATPGDRGSRSQPGRGRKSAPRRAGSPGGSPGGSSGGSPGGSPGGAPGRSSGGSPQRGGGADTPTPGDRTGAKAIPPAEAGPAKATPVKAAPAKAAPAKKAPAKAAPAAAAGDGPVKATPPRADGIPGAPTPADPTAGVVVKGPGPEHEPPAAPSEPADLAAAKATPAKVAKATPAKKTARKAAKAQPPAPTPAEAEAAATRPHPAPPAEPVPARPEAAQARAEPPEAAQARAEPPEAAPTRAEPPAAPAEGELVPAADSAPSSSVGPLVATVRTEAWAKLVADPGHTPELLALAAVQTIGPRAQEWAQRTRESYPNAAPESLARLAQEQFTRFGSVGSLFAAVAGSYAPVALLASNALTYAELILHIAAAYGIDPADERRAADLLVLAGVHPGHEDAEAALAAARQPAYEDDTTLSAAVWRLGRMVVVQAAAWTAVRAVNRFFPGTALLAAVMTSRNGARTMAGKATAFYRAQRGEGGATAS